MPYRPSPPLTSWRTDRREALRTLERAHAYVGGVDGPGAATRVGRPAARAYVVVVMSEFQGFVRDLHDLAVEILVTDAVDPRLANLITKGLTAGRAIDRNNATIETIKTDFGRLGLSPLDLSVYSSTWEQDQPVVREMMRLRNAIAHARTKDLEEMRKTGVSEAVSATRRRLASITRMAAALDRSVWDHLGREIGRSPW